MEQEKAHGMVYSFVYSVNEVIVQKPEHYDEDEIHEIWNSYEDEDIPEKEKINIIAIMLESYNDFSKFDLPFSKYPYDSLDWIKENSFHGSIVNNMFGGGTAFVERYFLRGSYYYSRYYKPVNSYVWYLKDQGYKTISMHPNSGGFYNRQNINPKLGFDEFYYMENYFQNFDKGGKHFMDKNLYPHILKNYKENTKDNTPYFNFTVTMQNHGPYDSSSLEEEYIARENFSSDESYYIVNNYFHGIQASSNALKEFLKTLEKEEKPTLVIAFGDHNPFLGEEDIGYKDLNIDVDSSQIPTYLNRSRTPYIVWGNPSLQENFGNLLKGEGPEISAQFLMGTAFEQFHWKGPKYMQIVREELPKVDIFNDRLTRSQGEFFTSESNKYKEIEDFVKNLDYYNNKMFYYDPLWKEK
ncbi:LTA synthase family protein [Peptoniphilus sp. KCTC 25270]|uniref:LTA synthase family protein n=1 Tax=Peptoniphilus sp. KCTC 25270 TaxID=2897414 RepID=UPI001E5DEE02|nr:LTA synthase family protein [Peptoniphilus sp. KCTC 25270]